MQYALLIHGDEAEDTAYGTPEWFAPYGPFTEEVQQRGAMRGGVALKQTTTATTIRVRDGERLVTDGPFAETKEQLNGFYLLECKDLDEALEYAAKIPHAQTGSVEVRPIFEMG
jgi:hypothetical protein